MSRPQDANDRAALRAISIAAAKRRPCPSDDDLAYAIGARGTAAGAAALARLEKRGDVIVERLAGWRTVKVTATGLRTT